MAEILRRGSFLVVAPGSAVAVWPREIWAFGSKWYRFMDKIFCPEPVHRLTPALVAELCELRLDLLDSIIDRDVYAAVAGSVVLAAANCSSRLRTRRGVVLDFGMGAGESSGRLRRAVPGARLVGCDISLASLRRAGPETNRVLVPTDGTLPLRSGSIDVVAACFVMHFGLPRRSFAELFRVTKPGGSLCANFYGAGGDRSLALLTGARWTVVDQAEVRGAKGHRVFSLEKPLSRDGADNGA